MYPPSEQAGRGMAMTTAVLSFICAAFGFVIVAISLSAILFFELLGPSARERTSFSGPIAIYAGIGAIVSVAFVVGAVKLLRHNPTGRIIIIASSAVYSCLSVYEALTDDSRDMLANVFSATPVLTLVFALLPGTKRWCER